MFWSKHRTPATVAALAQNPHLKVHLMEERSRLEWFLEGGSKKQRKYVIDRLRDLSKVREYSLR